MGARRRYRDRAGVVERSAPPPPRFYEREGNAVVKTQLAFVKTVDGEAHGLAGVHPRVSGEGDQQYSSFSPRPYSTSFIGIAASSDDNPWRPSNLTGGRSWNMKSHFQRSDGFDVWSQCAPSPAGRT